MHKFLFDGNFCQTPLTPHINPSLLPAESKIYLAQKLNKIEINSF